MKKFQQEDQRRGKNRPKGEENGEKIGSGKWRKNRVKRERKGEGSNMGFGVTNLSNLPLRCTFPCARVWYYTIHTLTYSSFNSKIRETRR